MKIIRVCIFLFLAIISLYWFLWSIGALKFLYGYVTNLEMLSSISQINQMYLVINALISFVTAILVTVTNLGIYAPWLAGLKQRFSMRSTLIVFVLTISGLLFLAYHQFRISQSFGSLDVEPSAALLYAVEILLIVHFLIRRSLYTTKK